MVGDRCDSCKANTFYLSDRYELGCVECFCMGVSRSCQSTSWNRAQVFLHSLTVSTTGTKAHKSSWCDGTEYVPVNLWFTLSDINIYGTRWPVVIKF